MTISGWSVLLGSNRVYFVMTTAEHAAAAIER